MNEIWKDIEGYEGRYQISSFGRLKSLARESNGRCQIDTIMNTYINHNGYSMVSFSLKSKMKKFRVSRLVAIYFIPNPENKPYVNHINGIKLDNRVENLEWCTPLENITHAISTGLNKPHRPQKLTKQQVHEIRHSVELTHKLALRHNVARSTIRKVRARTAWTHV